MQESDNGGGWHSAPVGSGKEESVSLNFWKRPESIATLCLLFTFFVIFTLRNAVNFIKSQYKTRDLRLEEDIADNTAPLRRKFWNFQIRYVIIFVLGYSADIIGAPYLYYMFSHYHTFSEKDIRQLTQIPFMSGAITCCIVPPLVDLVGRRIGLTFTMILYIIRYSFLIFFVNNKTTTVMAQIIYGIAVLLLFSVPESWMIEEHRRQGFPDSWLQYTYTAAYVTQAVTCICITPLAGVLHRFFDLSAVFISGVILSTVNIIMMSILWSENTGHGYSIVTGAAEADDTVSSIPSSFILQLLNLNKIVFLQILTRFQIFIIGLSQSLIDSIFWIFTSLWTPLLYSLSPDGIFTAFMVSWALGSYIATIGINPLDDVHTTTTFPTTRTKSTEEEESVAVTLSFGINPTTVWKPVLEAPPPLTEQTASMTKTTSLFHIFHSIWNNGLPLRLSVVFYQILFLVSLIVLTKAKDVVLIFFSCIIFMFAYGLHCCSFGNLKAQIIPPTGRVVTLNIFSLPSGLLNYFFIANTDGWPVSDVFNIAVIYSSIVLCLTLVAWSFKAYYSRPLPNWHPQNPNIERTSSISSKKIQSCWPSQWIYESPKEKASNNTNGSSIVASSCKHPSNETSTEKLEQITETTPLTLPQSHQS